MADMRIHWASHALIMGLMGVLFCMGGFFLWHRAQSPQRFIVITGISSAGKSSTADALRKVLGK